MNMFFLYVFQSILWLFCTSFAFTAENERDYRVSRCLGQEEEKLHKKREKGPPYIINQHLLSSFLNMPGVTLSDELYRSACVLQQDSPSLKILEEIFEHFESAFAWTDLSKKGKVTPLKLEEIYSKLADLFNIYYLNIQRDTPDLTCLERKIPKLSQFLVELKYLSQELTFQLIANREKQLSSILPGLKNSKQIFQQCLDELKTNTNSDKKGI